MEAAGATINVEILPDRTILLLSGDRPPSRANAIRNAKEENANSFLFRRIFFGTRGWALIRRASTGVPSWDHLVPKQSAYVGGSWIQASSGKNFEVLNPANDEFIRSVPAMSTTEVRSAINSAVQSQSSWAARASDDRSKVVRQWAKSIRDNMEALAQLITTENGKTLPDARNEVASAIAALEWYAEEAKRTYGYFVPTLQGTSRRQLIHHQPVGVVGVITPWNFPVSMITRKVGAAVAAGCSVVLKPAEDTPLSALALTYLATSEAGLPAGVLNTVTTPRGSDGAEQVGNVLCSDANVRLIGFTGSTTVGKMLYHKASAYGKRVQLELGGNAPFIVFASANLDKAVSGAIATKFRCSGQTCVSANRILVEESIYDQFVDKLTMAVSRLTMGDGTLPDTRLGPLINHAAVDKVHNLVESAKTAGAIVTIGGSRPDSKGCFYPATVIANCNSEMACVRNEIFGPVAPIIKFRSQSEVIQMANDTDYGLAAYVYTQQISQAWQVAEKLQFGMIGINSPRVSSVEMPFGGVKGSGIGREGGPHALLEFMDVKTFSWDLD
ncbi:putative succinate-semialdehyde dehydrogenase [Opisthorchis viverrini]|uniref:Putative succinate-semialdehyde dehydrogenase n=1 Tax=Opisthorchis viverrini TaxID=6198 RepID=A0A1S8WGX0_OPIVI|nr:putative succinate-semialdehyde dehydrogenase [Opisthorchis viverrini]